ncbi:hypothetical protein BC826DRAFT_446741 [Russula brevipes]|nr:hypothetical protein BC826DRAFT_446741 [Russula brevipes]
MALSRVLRSSCCFASGLWCVVDTDMRKTVRLFIMGDFPLAVRVMASERARVGLLQHTTNDCAFCRGTHAVPVHSPCVASPHRLTHCCTSL